MNGKCMSQMEIPFQSACVHYSMEQLSHCQNPSNLRPLPSQNFSGKTFDSVTRQSPPSLRSFLFTTHTQNTFQFLHPSIATIKSAGAVQNVSDLLNIQLNVISEGVSLHHSNLQKTLLLLLHVTFCEVILPLNMTFCKGDHLESVGAKKNANLMQTDALRRAAFSCYSLGSDRQLLTITREQTGGLFSRQTLQLQNQRF